MIFFTNIKNEDNLFYILAYAFFRASNTNLNSNSLDILDQIIQSILPRITNQSYLKGIILQSINLNSTQNFLNNLYSYYSNNENPEMILNYPTLVDNLTAGAVQTSIKKYFDMNNYVKVVLYPENK